MAASSMVRLVVKDLGSPCQPFGLASLQHTGKLLLFRTIHEMQYGYPVGQSPPTLHNDTAQPSIDRKLLKKLPQSYPKEVDRLIDCWIDGLIGRVVSLCGVG